MHVAHPAPVERFQEVRPDAPRRRGMADRSPERARTCLALTVLLLACSLALVDGLLGNSVAFERDTADFYYPLMAWVGQQLGQGTLPLWAPPIFGGYPIFADGEIGLAYAPVLLALLALPTDRALIVLRLGHLFLASAGCYALARVWGLTQAGAIVAGLTFALGSFLQAQTHHENIVRTAAWLPVVLALVERALRREGGARLRWTAAAALALGMAGLGLHSQVLAIELLALVAYALFRLSVGPIRGPTRPGPLGHMLAIVTVFGPVVLLGLGLAAVQLIPLAELASFSPRGSGIPYAEAAAYSLTPLGLVQLIFPFVFRTEDNQQWGLWTHWESYLYVGLAPLVLAVLALVRIRRREVVGWGVMGLVGLMLALGQYSPLNLHYWLWLLPGVSGLRAPGRFTLIIVLAAAMLAAHGLTWLQRQPRAVAQRSLAVACGLPIAIGGLLAIAHALLLALPEATASVIDRVYLSEPRDVLPLTTSQVYAGLVWSTDLTNLRTLGALGGLLLVAVALLVWQSRWGGRQANSAVWPGVLAAITLVDLTIFSWSIHPRAPLATLGPAPSAVRALTGRGDGQPFRVLASPVLTQVASDRLAPFGLQDANGYSSLESSWHGDYLHRTLRVDDQLLDLWNVRYIIDPAHFGAVPSYKDVHFLPQQPMLQAGGGSSIGDQTFRLDAPTSAVEVRLVLALMDGIELPQGASVGEVTVRDPDGRVVAQHRLEAGLDVMDWSWDDPRTQPYVHHARVEVAGVAQESGPPPNQRLLSFARFGVPDGTSADSVEVRATSIHGELTLYGLAVIDSHGAAQQLFGRRNAKYRPAYRDANIAVFDNTAAFPRAFVVSGARVASDGTPLDEMMHRPFDPRNEVILARGDVPADLLDHLPATSDSHEPSDQRGAARVEEYGTNRVRIAASTPRDALLVLSDTAYPGWRAFVDGREQPVMRGDLLFRVVPLPTGQHQVEFRFEPLSIALGLLVSLASLVLVIGLVLAGSRSR